MLAFRFASLGRLLPQTVLGAPIPRLQHAKHFGNCPRNIIMSVSIPHIRPGLETVESQDRKILRLQKLVTIEAVNSITAPLGYTTKSIRRLLSAHGVINLVYIVTAQAASETVELILRVTNPRSEWAHLMQRNEVNALDLIHRWNMICKDETKHISVPVVLSYSDNAETSLLGCEYSLVTKMPGTNAEDAIESMSEEKKLVLWKDWLRITKSIESIPISLILGPNHSSESALQIGSLSYLSEHRLGPIIRDGPAVGPFRTFGEINIASLRESLIDMENCPILTEIVDRTELERFKKRLTSLVNLIEKDNSLLDRIWPSSPPYSLYHDDLHMGNLLVDEDTGKITAVLDWDRTTFGHHIDDALKWGASIIGTLFEKEEEEEESQILKQAREMLREAYKMTPETEQREKNSAIVDNAAWLTHMVSTWYGSPPVDSDGHLLPRNADIFKDSQQEILDDGNAALDQLEKDLHISL